MMQRLFGMAMALWIGLGAAMAAPLDGQETYDLLFRNGTLDTLDRSQSLVYSRDVTNRIKPEIADRDSGAIALSIRKQSDAELAHLEFTKNGKHRGLGNFPASVGNPMIMYFYESVVRDMAESAGGSPFYIRNRVKEALVQPTEMETGEAEFDGKMVETKTVRLYPFKEDPNAPRMQGFGNLELRVTMSDAVPGWYLSLVAVAASGDATPVYRSEMKFDRLEDAQ